jgi:hypothetical protein
MNVEAVLAEYQKELREIEWPGEVLEPTPWVTRRRWTSGEQTMVVAFGLTKANTAEVIEQEKAHFENLRLGGFGKSFEWKVFSFDSPPDLREHLQAAGFEVGEREAVVMYDLDDGLEPFETEQACEVKRVETLEQLADYRSVAEAVFEKDYTPTTQQLKEALESGQRGHDAYLGYVDGEPVSTGRLYTNPTSQFAGLYGGGTHSGYRGKGCYRAVIGARARDAVALGARYLQVDAMPTSFPILKRLGFVHVADSWPCTWPPEESGDQKL